ncbi:unnamed protein product [Dibothriocephalus latus]|uniref:Protein xylosyltransferase n=1 Tax=Dibothriocephalus latus TaxID=60516 RepID=A0A3P6T9C7_DIBLA|nr:unnamed protein product [Dibothriocephalus latus]
MEAAEDSCSDNGLVLVGVLSDIRKHFNYCQSLLNDSPHLHNINRTFVQKYPLDHFLTFNANGGEHCHAFRRQLDFPSAPISDVEKEFAIAFAIAVFKDINQVARLLRMIYRPQNFYVIHVDRKSSDQFYQAVVQVQKCFGKNVRVVPRKDSVDVGWFTFTVLEVELIASRILLQMGKWRYFINLTGQELPLRTNLELVLALKALNGSNLVEGTVKHRNVRRIPNVSLPFPVTWVKGGVHVALRREFVEFMLFDPKAKEITRALQTHAFYKCPDEQFFATLAYNPHLGGPGACLRVHEQDDVAVDKTRLHFLIRYKKWYGEDCPTKTAHGICILGSQSLSKLMQAADLIANKFHEDYYPEGYDCLELYLFERTNNPQPFDTTPYARLYCSHEHL